MDRSHGLFSLVLGLKRKGLRVVPIVLKVFCLLRFFGYDVFRQMPLRELLLGLSISTLTISRGDGSLTHFAR